jgi:hypothetical protein
MQPKTRIFNGVGAFVRLEIPELFPMPSQANTGIPALLRAGLGRAA